MIRGEGSYQDRVVEFDKSLGLFKVYRKVEYPYSFALISREPKGDIPSSHLAFWKAHCVALASTKEPDSCNTHYLIGDLLIEVMFPAEDIVLVEQIQALTKAKIESWKQ